LHYPEHAVVPNADIKVRPVLIASGERVIADTLAVILSQQGYAAVTAYGGLDAVDKARQQRPWFALVDLIMRDMNGIDAGIRIIREEPDCQVLLCSAQGDITDLSEYGKQQGYEFEIVPAPMHPQNLLEKLRTAAIARGIRTEPTDLGVED
jgi:DNA-binding NtrC family response regulator